MRDSHCVAAQDPLCGQARCGGDMTDKSTGILPTLALAVAIVAAPPAFAVPIAYTEQVTATGSLGGVAFTDATIVLQMHNDTGAVNVGPPAFPFFIIGTATVTVGGGPTATFKNPIGVIATSVVPGVEFFDETKDAQILLEESNSFAGYNLQAAIGPISGTALPNKFANFPTSGGNLIITTANAVGTFTASTSPTVSEPSALALLGVALAGLARRRKAA
jgi:MYXO-CTERM domain-containing protein